jgi:transcriptional regulator with XRE-family HTH domain
VDLEASLALLGEQIRAARALLRWTQKQLADDASAHAPISVETIKKWEATDGPIRGMTDKAEAVAKALTNAGIELLNDGRPGARRR